MHALQRLCARWCPACYLLQQRAEAVHQALEFLEERTEAHTKWLRQLRVSLLERKSFGNDANLLAAERIEPLPEAALRTAISAEPFFAGSGGTAGFGFGDRRCSWRF